MSLSLTDSRYISSLETSLPTFAPSRTLDYLRCPALWDLSARWSPRKSWAPYLEAGHAIHKGMEVALRGLGKNPLLVARESLAASWPGDLGEWTFEGVANLVEKGLKKGLKTDLLEGGEVVAVEDCLDHAHETTPSLGPSVPGQCAITDLISRDATGNLGITDHKSKLNLEARWVDKELHRADHNWQLYDYARRAMLRYREPVTWARVHLIVCGPTARALTARVQITPARMKNWFRGACFVWALMTAGRTWQNFNACDDFGGCPMHDMCHTLAGDESLASALYAPKGLNAIVREK